MGLNVPSFEMRPDPRAVVLSEKVTDLAKYVYNGNLDDEAKLRKAISDLVTEGIGFGYELGRAAILAGGTDD